MIDYLVTLSPVTLALLATLFTWLMTAFGSMLVFFFKEIKLKILNAMLGFAAGVMIAASFFSLIAPAIELTEEQGRTAWLMAAVGFGFGAFFLWVSDHLIPHLHFGSADNQPEGLPSGLRRSILLVLSITLHNIPEGLAVGVAFGAVASQVDHRGAVVAAMVVALGIGIQNFPEGAAVSIPLRREGLSRFKAFMYGQASGVVEPIAGVLGALLVTQMTPVLPYALTFAAGAMIYVVIEELIPESQNGDHESTHLSTIGCIVGFIVMMCLDVALG